ncbi:hypothetical protein RchiOBHm_Chr4g0424771 [Rosa chinensis]|uniref:Uncharacterized protein n=1 Tax=Rosa chinensis TaxID=74649 RepID=A0A2P6QYZ9_ROSCH|nr:hypothetical protein RchiOBHm_Chr4g0424771 [Rosa chinensis]
MASVGQIFLKSQKPEGSDKSKVMNIEHANGKGSAPPQPASKNGKGDQRKKNGNKKKKGKGKGDVFTVEGNEINGGKADKCGVFGFGNKYYGGKKPKEDESSEEESDSSDE